ncbi:flagellar hook-length control protein FliK [Vibrio crassostreae]|uniref:flagellar hook-length control protein FliK n=1 Tax=Vibrio crassostreae TaxID=246167 RepID=UPI000F4A2344|nr:flagellar hook-length control protein FliK [Vibrio crassostreae]ROO58241.1 flagellar hook-length control protein FliK [Vibrio crassostreae]ROO73928.1 flagellar hook-length control protein FliK [Vibrio crassostreae]TCW11588.1 flagellar hook-length control protein FliK [Vibrio crassostreae]CAK3224946.1 flagellar hook-length control protein FliK [Vibrio crassostreae]CAK3327644.1 flagellar hook-length control protein FliK [Vibrio crassostreae]
MNVSLSSNSAANKTSSLLDTGSASSKVEETGDSKGFFESFKEALGFEESDSKAAVKDSESTTKSDAKQASTEGEASAEADKGDSAESKATEEVSEAQSKQAASGVEGDKATDKTSTEAASDSAAQLKAHSSADSTVADNNVADKAVGKDAQATTNDSKEQVAQPQEQASSAVDESKQASQASAAMNEGNKLLGQLDEANKTLNQTPNGKALPQQSQLEQSQFNQAQGNIPGASVAGLSVAGEAGKQVSQANAANQGSALEVDSEIAVLTGGKGVSQLTDDEIRQLMDKGVTPEQIEASMSRELSQKNAASAVAADQSQALSAADIELAKQVDAHTKALNQLNGQIESEQSVVDSLLHKQQSGAKLTVDEQAALAKATSNLDLLNQQLANVQQQATALLSQAPAANSASGEPAAIDWDNTDSSETKALAAAASTAAVATAAQQVSAQAVSQSANNALTDKAAMLHANNAHAAQQAAAQQANLSSPQQQAALDPALTAQGVAMNAAPAATKAGSTDMLLKAGAGAAALSGLGKASAKEDSKDSTFAQQIASVAGVQGAATAGSAPTRAEIQAAQQAPLQLTKELANEQVAEKVQMMMSKNLKNLDIRLDPPELGQMKIRMTMNNDVANVHFTVSNQQARDVIEQTLPRLREMLAQQGMQLADSSVQQQNSGQGQERYNSGEQQSGANRTNGGQGDENLDSGSNLELNVSSKRDGISYYA